MLTATMLSGVVANQSYYYCYFDQIKVTTRFGSHMICLTIRSSLKLPIKLGSFGKVFPSGIAVKCLF